MTTNDTTSTALITRRLASNGRGALITRRLVPATELVDFDAAWDYDGDPDLDGVDRERDT